jgi:hypothetical protein
MSVGQMPVGQVVFDQKAAEPLKRAELENSLKSWLDKKQGNLTELEGSVQLTSLYQLD